MGVLDENDELMKLLQSSGAGGSGEDSLQGASPLPEPSTDVSAMPNMGTPVDPYSYPEPAGPQRDPAAAAMPSDSGVLSPEKKAMLDAHMSSVMGDKFGADARQAIVDQNTKDSKPAFNWQAGLASLGASKAGGNGATAGQAVLDQQKAQRDQKLSDFDSQAENDPSSPQSKAAQQMAQATGFKGDVSKLTAAKYKQFSPLLSKMMETKQRSADRQALLGQRDEIAKQRGEDRANKLNDDLVMKMQGDMDPNKARGGNLAKNQAQIDQADRLKGLYTESGGDLRNLDSRQMEELAIGMNKMLSGSSGGSTSQVEALLPHSIRGDSQKLKEWLLNDPKGADQQKFVARMAETVEREREIAQKQVRHAQAQRLSAYSKLKQSDPERYKQVLNAYGIDDSDIDEKGQYKEPTKAPAMGNSPGGAPSQESAPQTKVVGGKTYMKVHGGWQEQDSVAGADK